MLVCVTPFPARVVELGAHTSMHFYDNAIECTSLSHAFLWHCNWMYLLKLNSQNNHKTPGKVECTSWKWWSMHPRPCSTMSWHFSYRQSLVGLARTVYIHRIWPFFSVISLPKLPWFWPTLNIGLYSYLLMCTILHKHVIIWSTVTFGVVLWMQEPARQRPPRTCLRPWPFSVWCSTARMVGVVLCVNAGTGKTETTKDLSKALDRSLMV